MNGRTTRKHFITNSPAGAIEREFCLFSRLSPYCTTPLALKLLGLLGQQPHPGKN
jgi:hypothetical protein